MARVFEESIDLVGWNLLTCAARLVLDRFNSAAQPVDGAGVGVVHAAEDIGQDAGSLCDEFLPRLGRLDIAGAFLADRLDANQQRLDFLRGADGRAPCPKQPAKTPADDRTMHRIPHNSMADFRLRISKTTTPGTKSSQASLNHFYSPN